MTERSERALARLIHWFQTDQLPGPDQIDAEARKLTPEDEWFYHRFLDLSVQGIEIERGEKS